MLTGNKGEWSEIYTLFKLLGDKVLQPGNQNLEKVKNVFYPILKVLRNDAGGKFEYSILDDLVIISGGDEILRVPVDHFKAQALYLLEHIQINNDTTFSVPKLKNLCTA